MEMASQGVLARDRYDAFSIIVHWSTAFLVIIQFLFAEFWDFFPHPVKHLMIVTHMSLGIVLTVVLAARIIWRLTPGHAVRDAGTGILEKAAKVMHLALYVLLTLQMPLGFLTRWTDNHPLDFFGLMIPSPLGSFSEATGRFVDQLHDINAWVIMGLAAAHALAALFHHYVMDDNVLRRMMPARVRKAGLGS